MGLSSKLNIPDASQAVGEPPHTLTKSRIMNEQSKVASPILVNQSLNNKKGSGKQVCRNLEANVSACALPGSRESEMN